MAKSFEDVPETIRKGSLAVVVNGRVHEVMALLADAREDGGVYVADDIFDQFGRDDERRGPSNYIKANEAYLSELASVSRCRVDNLIGLRKDGRYWCVHQVAVNYAGWLDKKVQVAIERAAIAFAKERLSKSFEWLDKRHLGTQTFVNLSTVIDQVVEDPPGLKRGAKFGLVHAGIQDPLHKAMGGPEKTSSFKERHGVVAAMDAYDIPWLNALNLSRSITASNIERKDLHDAWKARKEAIEISTELGEVTKRLLSS
jgi:hypothetical protein